MHAVFFLTKKNDKGNFFFFQFKRRFKWKKITLNFRVEIDFKFRLYASTK